jgi:predicted ribosomally synthesized peptide with SipW-like signal peptide
MKKILLGILVTGAVGGVAMFATNAFFSDTEKSEGNTFTAGKLDLTVDSTCHYWQNNVDVGCGNFGNWTATNLGAEQKFFNFTDLKPGDRGENTVSLHVDNDAWLRLIIKDVVNNDNGLTEPEAVLDQTGAEGQGELSQNLVFTVFTDANCDNIKNENDVELISAGPVDPQGETWALPGYLPGGQTTCFGITWNLPATVGNEVQSDSMGATMEFQVEQHRNNPTPSWARSE